LSNTLKIFENFLRIGNNNLCKIASTIPKLPYVQYGNTMKEIAVYLEVHYASVSQSIKRHETKRQKL